ncbi:MAG: chemotaxis response regulator protein-glutamate methylesterase [Bryobacterales bacterium]|nr:chemotaxis response regulator protein-glutamate methylesterase [Bryobacterales bacterium]
MLATAAGLRREVTIRAGKRARILVVDDSVVIRRLVTTALEQIPDFEVVGTAANGRLALQRVEALDPDVITMDIEMPEMNGLETLKELRARHNRARIIMFSTLTERGGQATLEALALGADDYATKASNVGALDRSMATLREELVPKIRHLLRWEKPAPAAGGAVRSSAAAAAPVVMAPRPARTLARRALVIGISTGGPAALSEIVPMFPSNFSAPILIVQHMPAMFTRLLAERLQTRTQLRVREAQRDDLVSPGQILIAPGDYHMRLQSQAGKVKVVLDQGPPENSCRPAADVLFRSAAEVWGGAVVAAVLTGMGQDGLKGVKTLSALGAYVIAQDEASSVVWGMPGAVATAGLAHSVVSLDKIVGEICKQF